MFSPCKREILLHRPEILELRKVIREGMPWFVWSSHQETSFPVSESLTAGEDKVLECLEKLRDSHKHVKPILCNNRLLSLTVSQIPHLRRGKNLTLILIGLAVLPVSKGAGGETSSGWAVLARGFSLIASLD